MTPSVYFKRAFPLIPHVCVFHREHPLEWGVEVSSGHGPREVRTSLLLSDRPLVDHVVFETGDLHAPLQMN